MGGGSRVWVFAGGVEFRVGERERILALVSVFVSEAGVLLLESSVLSLLRLVHCRGARSWGLRVGSVVLHWSVSPRLAGRVLVRRVPHSVELHWLAVHARGFVQSSQMRMPKSRNYSRCSLSTLRGCPAWHLVRWPKRPGIVSKGLDPRHQWHLRTSFQLNGSSSWDVVWAALGLLLVVCVLGACGGW